MYPVGRDGSVTRLNSGQTGAARAINPVPGQLTGARSIRFEVIGSSLKLFVDGELAAAAFDTTIAGPGLFGIRGGAGAVYRSITPTVE